MPTYDIETYLCQCGWTCSGSNRKINILIRLHHKKCDCPNDAITDYESISFQMGKDKIVKDNRSAITKTLAFGFGV